MDLALGLLGFSLVASLGLWGVLTMSRNGDLRVEVEALDIALEGQKEDSSQKRQRYEDEHAAHSGTIRQLTATEKLVVEQATVIAKLRNGEHVADDEFPAGGRDMLDGLLDPNKNSDGEDSNRPPGVPDTANPDGAG